MYNSQKGDMSVAHNKLLSPYTFGTTHSEMWRPPEDHLIWQAAFEKLWISENGDILSLGPRLTLWAPTQLRSSSRRLGRNKQAAMEKSSLAQFPGPTSIKVREARGAGGPAGGGKETRMRCRCSIFRIVPTFCQRSVKDLFLPCQLDAHVYQSHTDTHPAIFHNPPAVRYLPSPISLSPPLSLCSVCLFVSLTAHPGLVKTRPDLMAQQNYYHIWVNTLPVSC